MKGLIFTILCFVFVLFAPAAVIVIVATDFNLSDVADDPRAYWYDQHSLPEVWEQDGKLYKIGYNVAHELDKTGTPNNEAPWLHTGGLDNCNGKVTVKRILWIPPSTKIRLYKTSGKVEANGLPYTRVFGTYPNGTIVAEYLLDGMRIFEIRIRRKIDDEWVTDQEEFGAKPAGYVAIDNCVDCHQDIGKHADTLDVSRDWYGTVRGLEVGGPIHWHPWETKEAYRFNVAAPLVIRDDVRHFVEWE